MFRWVRSDLAGVERMDGRLGQLSACGKGESQHGRIHCGAAGSRLPRNPPRVPISIDYTPMVMHGPAMARNKISTTVYITAEQNEQLKLLHHKTKVPVAEYIRQGIDLVLEREKAHLPGQLTLDVVRK